MKSLKEIVNDPATTLIDVRSPMEYNQQHIEGAANIPLEELLYRVNELMSKPGPVVLYCHSGNRSSMVVSILKQQRIREVYNGGGLFDMQYLLN